MISLFEKYSENSIKTVIRNNSLKRLMELTIEDFNYLVNANN